VSSSCQAKFQTVNLFGAFSTKKTDKTTKKREKKSKCTKKENCTQNFLYIRERERTRRTRRREKDFKRDEFDEIRPTNALMGRKRSEVTLVRENSGLGRRGDERGSGEESHLGWNLATDDVRFAETDGGRERLGE
jgi:transposase